MQAFAITLVQNGKSRYSIIRAQNATAIEIKACEVLQSYLKQISGVQIPIVLDTKPDKAYEILIGGTNRSEKFKIQPDGFVIETSSDKLIITGSNNGTLYGVYSFLEEYLGCRKYTATLKIIPSSKTVSIPEIKNHQSPQLNFRSVYYPDPETDQEYLDWHKLQRIEQKWGLWGHSFFKLVPVSQYFKQHPEYFSWIDGSRKPNQLCLTNPEVLQIVIKDLQARIKEAPGCTYWSVSQNDEIGGCECDSCSALNNQYKSPQGSLLTFINSIASHFPDKIISTLAYTYTRKPAEGLKPLKNVNILLSNIEINRSKPVKTDPKSEAFRKDFEGWQKLTNNIIIWDYVVQFTHYISPFPNLHTLNPNLDYFTKVTPEGFFIQGSVEVPGEFSELKSYILSKLLWNPKADEVKLRMEFLDAYYGKAGKYINEYINLLHQQMQSSGKRLDIYDHPVIPYDTYLNPKLIDDYSSILDKAENAELNNLEMYNRVLTARLPLEFTILQQARFYGIEAHGVFTQNGNHWVVRPQIKKKVTQFVQMLKKFGIIQLNESGLTPDQYEREWNMLFKQGPEIHKALNKPVTLLTPNDDEFKGKGFRTLVDGTAGNLDFQYNWLGWLGKDMKVMIDMEAKTQISKVKLSILENHRHDMFLPMELWLEISDDGKEYKKISVIKNASPEEGTATSIKEFIFNFSKTEARYIKVTALNQKELPEWSRRKNRKPWVLTDEIVIE